MVKSSRDPPCPKCGSGEGVVPIVYGYPSPEMGEAAEKGEMVIGGCLVGAEDPRYCCRNCRIEFDYERPELLDAALARRARRQWR